MRRVAFLAALAIAIIAGSAPAAKAEEMHVGSVRLYNGTPCLSGQCQFNQTGHGAHSVVTGVSRAYLGWFYVWPDMSYRYISFNANAYSFSGGLGYQITLQGRIFCNGYWHYTQAKTFTERDPYSAVYLGAFTMLSPC